MEIFPPGKITKYGITLLKEGIEPLITYTSPDGEIAFYLNGGLAPWPGVTEGVVLQDGIQGMHAIFEHLDHKGARQDGASWRDTVCEPAEMTMKVTITAINPESFRRIMRKWFAAWDPEKAGRLNWVTPDGEWWCHPRFHRPPPEKLDRAFSRTCQQTFTWVIRNDAAFWQSYDSVSQFLLSFETAFDDFNRDDEGTLGPNWAQFYTGPGGGVCETEDTRDGHGRARWSANDPDTTFTGRKAVIAGPFKDYSSSSDDQVISFTVNNTPEFTVGTGAANSAWGRMGRNPDGSWDGNGVRATVGWGFCEIAVYVDFERVDLDRSFALVPPLAGEEFIFQLGRPEDERKFRLIRHGTVIVDLTDEADLSLMGADYRGVGFGLQAGGAILTQATPAQVRRVKSDSIVLDEFDVDYPDDLGPNWPLLYSGAGPGYVRALNGKTDWVDTALGRKVVNRWLGANEVQRVEVLGSPTQWGLKYDTTETTASLTHPATPEAVQAALEALPSLTVGDVEVTGPLGGPYDVTFLQNFAKTRVPEMKGFIVAGGTDPYVAVSTTTDGAPAVTETDYQVVTVKLGTLFQFPFPDAAYIDVWARRDEDDENPTGIRLRIGPQWVQLHRFINGVGTLWKQTGLVLAPLWNETWTLMCGRAGDPRFFTVKRGTSTILTYKEKTADSMLGPDYRNTGFGMESGDGVLSQNIPPSILDWRMGDNAGIKQTGFLRLTNFGDQDEWPTLTAYGPGTFSFGNGPSTETSVVFGPIEEGRIALIETDPGKRGVYDISTDIPRTDELYKLLKGRWSNPVPARKLGFAAEPVQIPVSIEGGNYDSRVDASITPRKRWPG